MTKLIYFKNVKLEYESVFFFQKFLAMRNIKYKGTSLI